MPLGCRGSYSGRTPNVQPGCAASQVDCPRVVWAVMDTSHGPESFRGLLLRHRGRTGLIQRDLATRAGVSRNSVQDWESGLSYPTAERLQGLIRALLETAA
jgi:DNA-binding XRE family transcriptional regulator